MTDLDLMPFGKYKGTPMQDVPASYLLWLRDQGSSSNLDLDLYIKDNLTALLDECPDHVDSPRNST